MKIKHLSIVILFLPFIISCKKYDAEVEENPIPVASIVINSPVAGAVYQAGDSVTILATAVSTDNLHGYDVFITKANDTTAIFFEHIHEHTSTAIINRKWKAIITAPADLEAHVTVYLDHDLHTAKKKVGFRVQ